MVNQSNSKLMLGILPFKCKCGKPHPYLMLGEDSAAFIFKNLMDFFFPLEK